MTDPDAAEGLSRRTLLRAVALAPLATAVPLVAQTVTATPAAAASYTLVGGRFTSASTGRQHKWVVTYPAGHGTDAHLPVAIVMHGSNQTAYTMAGGIFGGLGYPERLDALIRAGKAPAFALASIDGYNGYYEKKGSRDYGKLVATEFLDLLTARGLDTSRLALTGWSMGGWGALRLAQRELRGRVKAITATSTPCYPTWKSQPSSERADQTKAQFDANNFYHHPGLLAGVPIYLLCGTRDGFYKGNKAFAKVLAKAKGVRTPKVHFSKGGHTTAYWKSVVTSQLQFVGKYV